MQNKLFSLYYKLSNSFLNYRFGNLEFSPSYLQVGLIVLLLFLLVLVIARMRRLYLNWSIKGAISMIAIGFFLALVIEGLMLIGGRTFLSEFLGWKNPPKFISGTLNMGREKMVKVLGIKDEIPQSNAAGNKNADDIIKYYNNLTSTEAEKVRESICKP